MEPNKSLGGALVDVFDAAVNLAKTEARALTKRATDVAKAKGIGVVLLLASTGPLVLGLIFLILALFYGLIRLGLGAWAAALFIALASFGLAGILVVIGLGRLSAKVKEDEQVDDYDLKTPYSQQESELRGDTEVAAGRARVPQDQQPGAVQQVHLHGGAKVEGVRGDTARMGRDLGDNKGIVPTAPEPGLNAGEGRAAAADSRQAQDAGPHAPATPPGTVQPGTVQPGTVVVKPDGIPVSTKQTYKEDMTKDGY